uniref:Ig-like domain-containing protein n=1 Tax=Meloidogyne hapla TaxID=6305 RepID=A0A1I8BHH4_MELHA
MSKRIFLLLFLLLILFIVVNSFDSIQIPQIQRHSEMLVPLNSTTALLCELVFNQGRPNEEARWIHEGKEVARVNGQSNAFLNVHSNNPSNASKADPIPEIGFLIIQKTLREHEGDYWCERLSDGQLGERTRLRVAFLKPFETGVEPIILNEGSALQEGQLVVLDCPQTFGVPPPIINWKLNGERLIDFLSLNMEMAPNGSLLLHNFSTLQSGFYTCEAANFVAKTLSEPLFVGPPITRPSNSQIANNFVNCLSVYVRSGVLWFLVGCLATSCMVLAYILGALFLYRLYSSNEQSHRLRRWPCCPFLSTSGFRKVIAPMDNERICIPPPPYYEESV